jgi:mannose-1-phosphate guanylyltransferase / mannose-6-phosphate isomerase
LNFKMEKNVAVILSGGAGSRLWPVSRDSEPKQFQVFTNGTSLLSQTVVRADSLKEIDEILIVCSANHESLVSAHASAHTQKPISYLLEPVARNTAAALACAAGYLQKRHPKVDVCMVVLPSDHHMTFDGRFQQAIGHAIAGARAGFMVTFGITATKPDTGFGYLEEGELLSVPKVHRVKRFVEKPNALLAQQMLQAGGFSWNSGMFVMRVNQFLSELERFEPHIFKACSASLSAIDLKNMFATLDLEPLVNCPSTSVDYAVFERSESVAMVSLDTPWTDLGSWAAVAELHEQSESSGPKKPIIVSVNASQNYVQATKTVAIVGVNDLVIIDTPDALLISHRNETQSVRDVVAQLKIQQPELTLHTSKVRCPWGIYEYLGQDSTYKVKRFMVEPQSGFSFQATGLRGEHWIVLEGAATVLADGETATYTAGQNIAIDNFKKYNLENTASAPLVLLEVRVSDKSNQDDIERYETVDRCA